jgi:S-adenosylmethionine synthetase
MSLLPLSLFATVDSLGVRVYPKLIAPSTVQRRYLTDPLSAVDVDDGSSHQVAVRRSQENLEGAERSNDQVRSASSTSKDDGFPPIACMHRITLT